MHIYTVTHQVRAVEPVSVLEVLREEGHGVLRPVGLDVGEVEVVEEEERAVALVFFGVVLSDGTGSAHKPYIHAYLRWAELAAAALVDGQLHLLLQLGGVRVVAQVDRRGPGYVIVV